MALLVKNMPASAGDLRDIGSTPKLGRFPGGGTGNPLQYSSLMDYRPKGLTELDTTEMT